jgi:hypothetical protein
MEIIFEKWEIFTLENCWNFYSIGWIKIFTCVERGVQSVANPVGDFFDRFADRREQTSLLIKQLKIMIIYFISFHFILFLFII